MARPASCRIGHAVVAAALAVCTCCGPARGAERDYASLRAEVVRRLDAFKQLTARAEEEGIDAARERVTITTAELFLKYADWDARHPDELKSAVGGWWRVRKQAEAISRELPRRELREVLAVLAAARAELTDVARRPTSRRASPRFDASALTLAKGYFHCGDRPVSPSSFVWMPNDEKLYEAYGEIGGTYIHPPNLRADGKTASIRYRPRGPDEPMGYVFLGHARMPEWVRRKHPKIEIGKRHFTAYDIDHPATREVWRALLAAAVPQFAGRKVRQGGYLLANEPHWFSATGEWDTGPVSEHTHAKLRVWLAERHKTIGVLNGLWGTRYASFAEVSIEVPVDPKLRGTPLWYDWCRFNMHRVTDWFAFLKAEIHRHDPDAKVHIKLIPGHFAHGSRSHGLDFEALVRLQEILGCDAKIVSSKSWRDKGNWPERYACDWRNLAMPYDFFRSVSPGKLLFDSEFHGLSTVHWRDPNLPPEYVRCIYWLAHLHGMGMNQTWYWGRDADGSPRGKSSSGFHASNLTQPRVLDAFGRTMKQLNAFAPEVVALANRPRPVRLFYSETAAIQDATYMDHVYGSYKSLYHEGIPLGFVTGRMLSEADARELRSWPVVVVAHANHVTAAERKALTRYLSQGGTVVVSGSGSLQRDEYGRPHGTELEAGKGRLLRAPDADGASVRDLVAGALRRAGVSPAVSLRESNAVGRPGCIWRTAPWKDGRLVLIVNLGRGEAGVDLGAAGPCRDMVTNSRQPSAFPMKPFDVKLLHVRAAGR